MLILKHTTPAYADSTPPGGVGQGLFAESAMVMCTGFNCIPCMQKTALSSVLATSAQKHYCMVVVRVIIDYHHTNGLEFDLKCCCVACR